MFHPVIRRQNYYARCYDNAARSAANFGRVDVDADPDNVDMRRWGQARRGDGQVVACRRDDLGTSE